MSSQVNFNAIVDEVIEQDGLASLRAVVEKELLHYDILFCLSKDGLLKEITFQGGTSLRLCYGSNRFSEDLDFAGGRHFCSADLSRIKACIEKYLGVRYGLEVTVKEPKALRNEPEYVEVKVDKWQISVTTAPERKDLPKQRIKIEIANIPAYTKTPRPLARNYSVLPDGYADVLVSVETLPEIMADKLIAFPATTSRIRYRDMWDLLWLSQQNTTPDIELIKRKVSDYQLDNFEALLQARINSIEIIVASGHFHNEMRRFIPAPIYDRSVGQEEFSTYLMTSLKTLLTTVKDSLYSPGDNTVPFKL
ncbi:nucleotidyl transferase AbiEii/AbiGii toxin family protein [Xenorhabdus bovienii]|uniref:nucleotidyl transferase AbiEii/AbiGii toxin family protein n=1 Tax=Xenorhabdus bovienii TaxID=40576 RepID=UPI0023B27011|nr:nucleotidyl transferase AbiEii/AbiGii toxin family protein [Xenorhabdus bovienii]MDE9461339.1 nucleotidyl transferase AbiEii/AbiGii toxin family protein [Xenorhabdus bovienii]MDE9469644.1 nucleotidyl transferase AbiEii/AbiGii toxin family protein [Xenorhabdus bovienii]MDE9535574.1 nucleotidyl transferase AbiEii/AbiGii toxin family protein [Xenorhabdus bovienii]MDE9538267.1 nucleotidyl transferase AbiEii/AbiGii toxin family protein [Xenorhabdus bovienii]MDE9586580.1 nucleotidyl transferase A